MAISYKKLWHILVDRNMKKKDLKSAARLTDFSMTSLAHDRYVSIEVLAKISKVLDCPIDDLMEYSEDQGEVN